MPAPNVISRAKSLRWAGPACALALVVASPATSRPSAAAGSTSEAPPDFEVPTPTGRRWRPSPTLPPFGHVNALYGGCKGPRPCGSLVSIAAFKSGRMKLRAFRTADGKPPVAPRDASGTLVTTMTPGPTGAAPIYELEHDGVLFAWATISPFVLEAEGPAQTAAQQRALRRSFRAWVDLVDDNSPTDDSPVASAPNAQPAAVARARDGVRDPQP